MDPGYIAIIIMVVFIIIYVINKLPIPLTAMLSAAAMVCFGIIPANTAWAAFGGDTILLVAGFLLLSSTFFTTGAASVLGDTLIRAAGGRPKLAVFLFFVAAFFLSFVFNSVALLAMFCPLVISVIIEAQKEKTIFEEKYMQMLAVVVCATGLVTLVGAPPNLAASGMVAAAGYPAFTFTQMAPIGIILGVVAMVWTFTVNEKYAEKLYPIDKRKRSELVLKFVGERESVAAKKAEELADPVKRRKANNKRITITVIIIVTIVLCLSADQHGISMGTIAILGGAACFVSGCAPFKELGQRIDWPIILMLAGTIGCAAGLGSSGGGRIIANAFLGLLGDNATPMLIFTMVCIITPIISQFISNAGTIGIMMPIGLAMAAEMEMHYMPMAVGIVVSASMSFCTPMSTPSQAIVLNWGSYKFSDYFRQSGPLNVVMVVVAIVLIPLIYPF